MNKLAQGASSIHQTDKSLLTYLHIEVAMAGQRMATAKKTATGSATEAPQRNPRKRDAERTRQTILTAAGREFAQNGFDGARIERIVKAAGCNIRLLYHYFGNKKQLYLTALEGAYDDIRSEEAKLGLDPDCPVEGLVKLLEFTFHYFQSNPVFEGLLRAENMKRGKFVKQSPRVAERALPLIATIQALVASGRTQRVLRDDLDAVDLYITITALSRFHLANAYSLSTLLGTDLTKPAWREQRLNRCRDLFVAYLTSTTPR